MKKIIKKGKKIDYSAETTCDRCETKFSFGFTDFFYSTDSVICPNCGSFVEPELSEKEHEKLMMEFM